MIAFIAGVFALVLLHETAHVAAAQSLGLRWNVFHRLPWKVGIAVRVNTARQRRIIGLAGPAANLAIAAPLIALGGVLRLLGLVSLLAATLPSAVDWAAVLRSRRLP